jgi:hypothetical protein
VLVVDGTAEVHDECGTGGVLNFIEPLPVGDDRSTKGSPANNACFYVHDL